MAGMSEGTMLTHVNRVRRRHPRLYQRVRNVRLAQLAVRHEVALGNAQEHKHQLQMDLEVWLADLPI